MRRMYSQNKIKSLVLEAIGAYYDQGLRFENQVGFDSNTYLNGTVYADGEIFANSGIYDENEYPVVGQNEVWNTHPTSVAGTGMFLKNMALSTGWYLVHIDDSNEEHNVSCAIYVQHNGQNQGQGFGIGYDYVSGDVTYVQLKQSDSTGSEIKLSDSTGAISLSGTAADWNVNIVKIR